MIRFPTLFTKHGSPPPFVFIFILILIFNLVTGSPFIQSYTQDNSHDDSSITSPHVGDSNPYFVNDDSSSKDILPTTEKEKEIIQKFDPHNLNYTALRLVLLDLVDQRKERDGKSLRPPRLPSLLSDIGEMLDFNKVINEIETSIMTSMSCTACITGVTFLQSYVKGGDSREKIIESANTLCRTFNIETPRVCQGIINLMADEVIYVARHLLLTPDEVCGFTIGDICESPYNPLHEWDVVFPPVPKPPIKMITPQSDKPSMKVLHLSDTHFDPHYLEGSNANCGEPMCCRSSSGIPRSSDDLAGLFGDYRKCDTPKITIDSMLQHITDVHKDIDYIIWTGDLPPHDIWNQTKETNLEILETTVHQLLYYFPHTPIFPALGNHESAPVNSFPPPFVVEEYGVSWLYNELNRHWLNWLPKENSPTILKGGFYSVLVRPKFRLISLNMNYCNNKNWWLLVNSTDPAQELQWLIYELQNAEFNGEKVHIIGHIPPGHSDCLKVWSHNYYKIINRYESTITAQFFGHTHFDEYEIFYDEHKRFRATNIAYIGPSVTSYYGLNPGYRLYTVEGNFLGSNKMVVDHETWVMNLNEANYHRHAIWYKLYSAKKAYRLRSLHPQEWDSLIYKMTEDEKLFNKYYRYYWKNSVAKDSCDSECKKRLLCDLKSGRSNDRKVTCAKVNRKIEAQERTDWTSWVFSGVTLTSIATWWYWG